jgi:hypothetical protein
MIFARFEVLVAGLSGAMDAGCFRGESFIEPFIIMLLLNN